MKQYLEALNFCYENGTEVESRAGKVKKCFGYQMQFDLSDGFPAVTIKSLLGNLLYQNYCGLLKDQMMKDD